MQLDIKGLSSQLEKLSSQVETLETGRRDNLTALRELRKEKDEFKRKNQEVQYDAHSFGIPLMSLIVI